VTRSIRPNLPGIAALRYFAALWVVLYHFTPMFHARLGAPLAGPAGNGYLGVNLFFLLSGFVLSYVYRRDDGGLAGSAASFWRNRFARIVPVYLFAWAATWAMQVRWAHGFSGIPRGSLAGAALSGALLQAWVPGKALAWNSPGWSLSVEAFFYLLFPALLPVLARLRRPLLVAAGGWLLAGAGPAAYVALDPDGLGAALGPDAQGTWMAAIKFFPPLHLGSFVAGTGLGLLFLDGRLRRIRGPAAGAAIVGALALATAWNPGPLYPLFHDGLLLPLFALLVAWCANLERAPRLLVEAGEASYALYILQFPLWELWGLPVQALGLDFGGRKALLAFAVFASVASWVVLVAVEKPARAWIRHGPRGRTAPRNRAGPSPAGTTG
jgi:peptidoglycan/LPS O-acetylase OafA/YrhL